MTGGLLDDAEAGALDTPAVVVDVDRMDVRIASMAALMRDRGIALRPHAKTHKSIEVARRQVEAGAVGLTVATIGEAEVFADAGLTDLFIAYPLVTGGPKADRLRRLASRCTLSAGADSTAGLDALAAALTDAPTSLRVVIEIDSGGARTGVRPEMAGLLARHARDLGLEVAGAFTHEGHGYRGRELRAAAGEDAVSGLSVAAESLRAEGFEPSVLSAGSTPTAELSAHGVVTEERPGTYVFGDRLQAALAGEPADDAALMVAATVVSSGPGDGFVIDAGAKILAQDVAPFIAGHGAIVGHPDAVIQRLNDHHGVVDLPGDAPRPAVGSIVWVVPNHVCPVINLVDAFLVAQGGRVVARWAVDARGMNG
jgi:D-serine deaminase-like pyridoxal phosphate-dependent protein